MASGQRAFAKKKAHRLEKLRAVHRALDNQIKKDYNKYQDVQGKKVEKLKLKEDQMESILKNHLSLMTQKYQASLRQTKIIQQLLPHKQSRES